MTFYAVVEVCVIFNRTNTQGQFDDKNRVKEVCAQDPGLNHAIRYFYKICLFTVGRYGTF